MENGNNMGIGIIEFYIIKRYSYKLKEICPEKMFKDVTVEITHDKDFPSRLDMVAVIFRYKDDIIITKGYCLGDGISFNYDVDVKNFLEAFKNKIFQNYCDELED